VCSVRKQYEMVFIGTTHVTLVIAGHNFPLPYWD
jgi:hypothetical protein